MQTQDTQFAAIQKHMDFYIQKFKEQGLIVPEFPKPIQQDIMLFSGFGSSCDTCYGTQSLYLIPFGGTHSSYPRRFSYWN